MSSGSGKSDETTSTAAAGTAAPRAAGQMLGKFELQKKLGTGGMGTVYLARDDQLDRIVALKVLPREKAANPALVRRFQAEADSTSQLRHESIVQVFEAGQADGYPYIALEYIDGTDVQRLVGKLGPLTVRRSLEIVKQVARGLEHAFQRGIVHRDIKPSNLLIQRDGTVKLSDMGLARSVDETLDAGITRDGTTVGTVDYMAPEQARDSKAADVRSDIYSLGCTWYFMLTGQPPFPKGSLTNKLYAHFARKRPDPRRFNQAIPQRIVEMMHKMMARSPRDRYQTPTEVCEALERASLRRDRVSDRFLHALTDVSSASGRMPVVTVEDPLVRRAALREERRRSRRRRELLRRVVRTALLLVFILGGLALAAWGAIELAGRVRESKSKKATLIPRSAAPACGLFRGGGRLPDGAR